MKLLEKIKSLKECEKLLVEYRGKRYKFFCFDVCETYGKSFSIEKEKNSRKSMNVDIMNENYISLYDFNMFEQETTYKMNTSKIKIVEDESI